jgi:CubicO group peptidase (beta-lactamase class C family)
LVYKQILGLLPASIYYEIYRNKRNSLHSVQIQRLIRGTLYVLFLCLITFLSFQCLAQPGTDPRAHWNGNVIANDTCKLIDNYLTQISNNKYFSGGLLIIKDGKKIFSKGYGWADRDRQIPFTPSTLASMGSITKAFTAAAIMKLYEQGKLSLNDSLIKYFPDIAPDKANITIHQLLTHSSGFQEFLQGDQGDYEKLDKQAFLQRAFREPLAFNPGTKAVYTNVGMSILAILVEQVSGMEYETFLKAYLFEPNQIKNIGYHYPVSEQDTIAHGYQNGHDWGTHQNHFQLAGGGPYWNLKGNGGLEASLNDMYFWANAFTNHTILGEPDIREMFKAQIREDGTAGNSYFGYGCNISQSRRNTKMIDNGGSNGIYFARMVRLPEEGLVLYMVTNESSINTNMVLPNITQLYFTGVISQDATINLQLGSPKANKIYKIIIEDKPTDLAKALDQNKIIVEDDMILLEVGQKLIEERKAEEALVLYQYYTNVFPKIVVAWNDMGDVYQMLNKKKDAIRCYKNALLLRPENQRAKANLEKLNK